jgi:Leucine-rich repeat (LRR) protein
MIKNIYLVLPICILLFGCKGSKETMEYSVNSEEIGVKAENHEENNEIIVNQYTNTYPPAWSSSPVVRYNSEFNYLSVRYDGKDLEFLEKYSYAKAISLNMPNLEDIEPLTIFDNIEVLFINSRNLIDISPIVNIKNLLAFGLDQCHNIIDLSPIENLNNLKHLTITNCDKIESIYPISNLVNLRELVTDIIITNEDLNYIVNLKGLEYLVIQTPFFDNVSPLLKLPNLMYLQLGSIFKMGLTIDIIPLAASSSLKIIWVNFFSSYTEYRNFLDNAGSIFRQNDIEVLELFDRR